MPSATELYRPLWQGLRSALYNVKINLGLIKDAAYVEQAAAKMQMLEAKALETEAFVLARTDEILK